VARHDLRLSKDEFYELTFRELHVLDLRHSQARKHNDLIAGILASAIANFGYRAPKEWVTPEDFGLATHPAKSRNTAGISSPAQVATLRGFFKGLASNGESPQQPKDPENG
jgi:hypothetical protein